MQYIMRHTMSHPTLPLLVDVAGSSAAVGFADEAERGKHPVDAPEIADESRHLGRVRQLHLIAEDGDPIPTGDR